MLVAPELMMHVGPPPQEVLDQVWLWKLLMAGFTLVFILQVVALDVAGALLTGLLLGFGWIMLRDGMTEMAKYALIYAVLCGLNFFFEVLPLISEISGRVTRRAELATPTIEVNGTRVTTYTLATQTHPFFDPPLGLAYNAESLAMLLGPACMGLGTYLSISAHNGIQRLTPFLQEDWDEPPAAPMPTVAPDPRPSAALRSAARAVDGSPPVTSQGRDTYVHFSGQSHKLEDG
mmetsp:Transcript_32789/g.78424  ORF Transcript_32789/g.78424 Transcript_32789/m.78424 type:complete len:233 (+) Transcript_32789:134-832(+)